MQGRRGTIWLMGGVLLGSLTGVALRAQSQAGPPGQPSGLPTEITQVRFNSGQSVVPYFEGWIKNADGSFDLVFGYFNRNWKQELAIPVGPDNKVEPMNSDAGQPTYFLPRRQRWVYRVRVPANFGKQTVVWSITANGKTERAYGDLMPAEEITERVVMTNGNFNPGEGDPNKPPTLDIAATFSAKVNAPLSLRVTAADDGLPKPRVAPPPKPAATTDSRPSQFAAQVNSSGGQRPRGLRVSWMQYRGPAKAIFEPAEAIPVPDNQGDATTAVRFTEPGTYKLIASATDGSMAVKKDVTVTVTP